MSDRDISEILGRVRRLDKGATPAPWGHPSIQDGEMLPDGSGYLGEWEEDTRGIVRPAGPDNGEEDVADCCRPGDAALIVAYRADALTLADEVERLQEELERKKALLRGIAFLREQVDALDVPYRPGLPTIEQVRAHEARGGRWQILDPKGKYPSEAWAETLSALDQTVVLRAARDVALEMMPWSTRSLYRPCMPDCTPCPWGDR